MRDYSTPERLDARLKEIMRIATTRGGKCLAERYEHCESPMEFECAAHGSFFSRPRYIFEGHWCKKCDIDSRKAEVEKRLIDYIHMRGGKLKSTYINAKTHVVVECPYHGEWKATPVNLLSRRSWCLKCARSQPRPGRRRKPRMSVPIYV